MDQAEIRVEILNRYQQIEKLLSQGKAIGGICNDGQEKENSKDTDVMSQMMKQMMKDQEEFEQL